MRGCKNPPRYIIHWPKKEIAGGEFVDSQSRVCHVHRDWLLHSNAPEPTSVIVLEDT